MKNLLNLEYWFNLRPESLNSLGQNLFIGLLILLLLIFILILIFRKKGGLYRGFLKKISDFCIGNVIIGSILLFFNYEIIPFFSARFWLAIWAAVMLTWFSFILKSLKKIKTTKEQRGKVDEYTKYLP